MAKTVGLLVNVVGDGDEFATAVRAAGAVEVEPILHVPERPRVGCQEGWLGRDAVRRHP